MAESNVKTSYYILLATFNTYMFSTLAFFWYNRKLELLQKRQPLIIAIHAITAICIGNDYVNLKPYNQIHWMYLSSGDIGFYLTNYFCAPLWLLFVFLRCCTVVSQYYSNIVYVTREMKMNFIEKSLFRILRLFVRQARKTAPDNSLASSSEVSASTGLMGTKNTAEEAGLVSFTPKAIFKIIAVTSIVELCLVLIAFGYTGCYNGTTFCTNKYVRDVGLDMLPIYIFVAIWLMLVPYFLFVIREVKDSLYLRVELQVTLCLFISLFSLFIIDQYGNVFSSFNSFGSYLWLLILVVLCHTVSVTVPTLVALVVHRKRQNLLIDHSLDAFNKILNDRRLFAEFKQSLAEDFCIENGLFWEDWMALQPSTESSNGQNTDSHSKTVLSMYKRYFQPSANLELNVTATTKKKIAKSIEQNNLAPEIFAEAKAEVFQMMYLNSFPRFILKLRQRAAYPSSSIHTSGKNFEITAV